MRSTQKQKWIPHVSLNDFIRSLPSINTRVLREKHKEFLGSQNQPGRFLLHGLKLWVPAGIYHPRRGSSSDFVIRLLPEIWKKSVLDLGTGSGVLGIYLAKRGNRVTLADISPIAIETAERNAFVNRAQVKTVISDLFDSLPRKQKFDRILFNYPLYQKDVEHPHELMACDPEGRLLRRFLSQLNMRLKRGGVAYLTYSNLGSAKLLAQRLNRKRFLATVIGYEHDPELDGVKYLVEIRRAPKNRG